MNRKELVLKLSGVTSDLFKTKGYLAFVDIFIELGYLSKQDYEKWRFKQIAYLEKALCKNLGSINFIMKTVRQNCRNGKCRESWTGYNSWGKGPSIKLRFSKTGNPNIEQAYATHFLKPTTCSKTEPLPTPDQ